MNEKEKKRKQKHKEHHEETLEKTKIKAEIENLLQFKQPETIIYQNAIFWKFTAMYHRVSLQIPQ